MKQHRKVPLSTSLITFILLLIPGLMLAGGADTSSLFTSNPNDSSMMALGYVFAGNPAIQHIMENFNLGILAAIAVWLSYTMINHVIKVATTGSLSGMQGGKSEALTTLIKVAIGTSLILPLPYSTNLAPEFVALKNNKTHSKKITIGGYSAIQLAVFFVIEKGTELADTMWNTGSSYMNKHQLNASNPAFWGVGIDSVSNLALSTFPKFYQRVGLSIMEDEACALKFNKGGNNILEPESWTQALVGKPELQFVGGCGSVGYGYSSIIGKKALKSFIDASTPLVKDYQAYFDQDNLSGLHQKIDSLKMVTAAAHYFKWMMPAAHAKAAAFHKLDDIGRNVINKGRNESSPDAKANDNAGWIMAGSYYWNIVEHADSSHLWLSGTDYMPPMYDVYVPQHDTDMRNFFDRIASSTTIMHAIYKITKNTMAAPLYNKLMTIESTGEDNQTAVSEVHRFIADACVEMITLSAMIAKGIQTNPILFLHRFGIKLLDFGFSFWQEFVCASVLAVGSLGIASRLKPGALANVAYLKSISAIVGSVCCIFFASGFLFAYFLPMYPFILFTICAIGWIISCIESIVAAPLVAFQLTHPEGHDFLDNVKQALMLMVSVFIQPALLILGLFFAVALSTAALGLIIEGFGIILSTFISSVAFNSTSDLYLGAIFYVSSLALFLVLVYFSVTKSYSVIYLLRDNVMRWIGAPGSGLTNADQDLQHMTGGFRSGGTRIGQAMTGMGGEQTKGNKTTKASAQGHSASQVKG